VLLKKKEKAYGGLGLVEEIGGDRATSKPVDEPQTVGANHFVYAEKEREPVRALGIWVYSDKP
jgi:hypothetical protein